ncbi:MAG TPA: GNAT family N-acetyltransferase [Desulfobacteraceae bacterium]|nr:MAG: GNAT family N-acetyltransferase [Deltaproteobacteria bacterium]HDZ23536.1 GNAT family N-acetyltransferase [Desulfobacteraceae bacterium]
MEGLVVRRATLEDANDISRIQGVITKSTEPIEFGRILREHDCNGEDASFVAEKDGKVVGFMISYIVLSGFGVEKSAWIASLGVDPKYMGQGIGKALAQEIFNVYKEKGIRNIFTSVRWDSADLLSFFKTLGFDRSDFINLRKQLSL